MRIAQLERTPAQRTENLPVRGGVVARHDHDVRSTALASEFLAKHRVDARIPKRVPGDQPPVGLTQLFAQDGVRECERLTLHSSLFAD